MVTSWHNKCASVPVSTSNWGWVASPSCCLAHAHVVTSIASSMRSGVCQDVLFPNKTNSDTSMYSSTDTDIIIEYQMCTAISTCRRMQSTASARVYRVYSYLCQRVQNTVSVGTADGTYGGSD